MFYDPALDRTFGALADSTRRVIVERLCATEEMSALEIADMFTSAQPTISKHLKVLEAAGLVTREKRGRKHMFRVNRDQIRTVESWSRRHASIWSNSLSALSDYLDEGES